MRESTKYPKAVVAEAVRTSLSLAEVMRKIGKKWSGGQQQNLKLWIKRYELDTSHFLGQAATRGISSRNKKNWKEILILDSRDRRRHAFQLRRALFESGREYKCESCGINEWNGKEITLQVDHQNGNWLDNRPENLQFLCPNCHSQTHNFSGTKGYTERFCRKKGN